MTRVFPRPSPLLPEGDQLRLLRSLVNGQVVGGMADDVSSAVAFFRSRLSVAGFLSPAEARRAASFYGRDKVLWRRELLAEAGSLCSEGLPVYDRRAGPLDGGLDWSTVPTGSRGDRLYRLRPHRFGFLPRLVLAGCLGAPTLPALHATLAEWIRWAQTANGAEEAYFSNLVIIYRLLAVFWAAPFVAALAEDGDETAACICLQLFRILAVDCRRLSPLIGKSAPNNHHLADCFVAWLLEVWCPEFAPREQEPAALEAAWQAELLRQFQEDGSNFEQSLHYHELGCEMAMAYLVISLRRRTVPAAPVLAAIAAMLRFQAALADRHGNGFLLGDSTDDPLLPLDAGGGCARGAWRVLYRTLFDPSFPSTPEAAAGAERAYWLLVALGDVELPLLRTAAEPLGQLAAFPAGGYFAFRDEERDDYLLFRTGPAPGTDVFPGHAMSDLLSVYWNSGGKAVLEPAGTYSYAAAGLPADGPTAPRAYFRSPAAHNGPVLRGHDPLGPSRGRFRNYDSGARTATGWRALTDVLAWAEGRLEEPGPLNGWRRGVLRVPGRHILVYDRLPPLPDDADVACHWQFALEAAIAVQSGRQVTADVGRFSTYLCASQGIAAVELARGRQVPAAGWLSRRYGHLEAAPQLICRVQPGTRAVAFIIGHSSDRGLPEAEVVAVGDEGMVIAVHQAGASAVCVFGRISTRLQDGALDLDSDGDVVWLGFVGDRCTELRTLGMRRIVSESLGVDLTAAEPRKARAGWRCVAAEHSAGRLCGRWESTSTGQPHRGRTPQQDE